MSPRTSRLLLALVLLAYVAHVLYLQCAAEDAYLNHRFSKHFGEGLGFIWNPGEEPVEGYTAFLWIAIGGGFVWLLGDSMFAWQVLGALAGAATILLTYRFAWRLLGWGRGLALVPCLLLAAAGPFATWAGSAMETNFYGMFFLAACFCITSTWQSARPTAAWGAFVCGLLAALVRPDGALLAVLLVLLTLHFARGREGALRAQLAPMAVCAVLGVAYFAARWSYFGYPLPNTYYLKTGGTYYQYIRGAIYTGWFGVLFVLPLLGGPLASLLTGPGQRTEHSGTGVALMTLWTVLVAYTAYVVYIGGDYMAMYRFFVPVLPLVYLLFGGSLHRVLGSVPDARRTGLARLATGAALAGTLLHSTPLEAAIFPKPSRQHGSYRGVQTERWHVARLSLVGEFFRGYRTDPTESVVTKAIGAIAYYADMRILDYHGWVDTHIAHKQLPGIGKGLPGHEKADPAYMFSKKPTFYMFSRELTDKPQAMPSFGAELDPQVRAEYKLMAAPLDDPVNGESGYFTFLQRKERPATSGSRVIEVPVELE